jgi:hypothetical protein
MPSFLSLVTHIDFFALKKIIRFFLVSTKRSTGDGRFDSGHKSAKHLIVRALPATFTWTGVS